MATLIKSDGTEETVIPAGKKWTLEELQKHVDGQIQIMPGIRPLRVIMDEEGQMKDKPTNFKATILVLQQLQGKKLRYIPVLVGNVLILDAGEQM